MGTRKFIEERRQKETAPEYSPVIDDGRRISAGDCCAGYCDCELE